MPKLNDQGFYYDSLSGKLLGNKAREELVLQEINGLGKNDFFLEVGCAQGHFEKAASKHSNNVFGTDYSFENLPATKRKCRKAGFVGVNAESLPFKAGLFDLVLCTEVLEHVPDWKAAFKELQRVAKHKIVVTVPLEKGYFWRSLSKFKGMDTRGHLHKLDSSDLVRKAGKNWKIARYEIVATPSRRINRRIRSKLGEMLGMYAMLVFEKHATRQKRK